MVSPRLLLALGAWLALVAGCDSAPGLPPPDARPSVTAFALAPATDSLGTDAPTAAIALRVALTVAGTGPVQVRALVRYAGTDSLVADVAQTVAPGAATLDVPLVLPRGAVGDYSVAVSTEGPDGRAGDGAAGVFRFRAANLGPPVVTSVTAPATVRPPDREGRFASLPVVVTVADPDGRANLAAVLLVEPGAGVIGALRDGGRENGSTDERAGDGRYSGTLQIPFGFPAGPYTLAAVAVDRAGAVSTAAEFTFTVQ